MTELGCEEDALPFGGVGGEPFAEEMLRITVYVRCSLISTNLLYR